MASSGVLGGMKKMEIQTNCDYNMDILKSAFSAVSRSESNSKPLVLFGEDSGK